MAVSRRFLERIAAKIDLVKLVGESVPLARCGRIHRGPCPVREAEADTLEVHAAGFFFCSDCRREGDALEWLMLTHHLSRSAAERELRQRMKQ
jgi:DNA primase